MTERSIFLAAIDIDDPAQRAAYLDQACGGDAALRRHIEELLAAEGKLGGFLARPHADVERTDDFTPLVEKPGMQIGPYKLMEQIGEGGFGLVFVAEQQQPVRRKVALKVIKPGMDTREVIARFEAERQALALMDHPNIARVLEAGTTNSGRPYFVMELVRGVPITEYCDGNQLTPQQRLELFVNVCQAVQHAHQKGVIHRDLKPSNILVAPHDGVPVVKVIDFGVAKALGQQLTDKTIYTRFAQMIGTPLYMSPEQAEINALDVDTRSDVYSLGVLLYELLTGTTPFDKKRLASAAFDEIRRIIKEEEPARPSTRVSTLGESLTIVSNHRGIDPGKLGQLLRGDLDVIVMKALEKERGRRYDSPNALADDIRRFLQYEAIVARPASSAYRLKKFVQRNWAAVAAGSAIAGALLLGLGISSWLAVRESRANRLARVSLVEAEEQRKLALSAKDEAERQRDRAEKAKVEESNQLQIAKVREAEAKTARMAEAEQRQSAERERDKATAASEELAKQKEQQRRLLYVAQMNLIQKAWSDDNVPRVLELLNASRPRPGETDLRSIEWHYWQRMLHQEERSFHLPVRLPAATRGRAGTTATGASAQLTATSAFLSSDGTRLAASVPDDSSRERAYILKVWDTTADAIEPVFARKLPNLQASSERAGPGLDYETQSTSSRHTIAFLDSQRVVLAHSNSRTSADTRDLNERIRNAPLDERGKLIEELRRQRQASTEIVLQTFDLTSPHDAASRAPTSFNVGSLYAFSTDGSRLATLTLDASTTESPFDTISILDGRTGATLDQFPSPLRRPTLHAISNGGQRLVIAESLPSAFGIGGGPTPQPVPQVLILHRESRDSVALQPQATIDNLWGTISRATWKFSPDSAQLAVAGSSALSSSAAFMLFDATSGRELPISIDAQRTILPSRLPTSSILAFSLDGKWLASTIGDPDQNKLALWEVATGQPGPEIKGHAAAPVLAAFSADSSHLLTADEHGSVKAWKVPSAVAPALRSRDDPRPEFLSRANSASWSIPSPDGRWTANAPRPVRGGGFGFTEVKLEPPYELKLTDKSRRAPPRVVALPGPAHSLEFSPDSSLLASVAIDPLAKLDEAVELRIWNVATGEPLPLSIPRFRASEASITRGRGSFAPPPSGRGPFPPSADSKGSPTQQRTTIRNYSGAPPAFSPDGRWLAVGGLRIVPDVPPRVIHLYLVDIQQRREIPVALPPRSDGTTTGGSLLRFSPDSKLLLATSVAFPRSAPEFGPRPGTSEAFQVVAAATGEFLWQASSTVTGSITISADSQRLTAISIPPPGSGNSQQSAVVTWEANTGKELGRIELPANRTFTSIAISPSGDRAAVQSPGGVTVYDVATEKVLYSLEGVTGRIRFTSDGQRLATTRSPSPTTIPGFPGGPSSSVESLRTPQVDAKVWDAVTGQELLSLSAESPLSAEFLASGVTSGFAPLPPQVEAESIVDWLSAPDADGHFLTRGQIAERLQTDSSLSAAARTIALRLAAKRLRRVGALANLALEVLYTTGLPREKYQQALEWLEEAIEQSPEDGTLISRQGLAHYRLGDYAAALASLEQSVKLQSAVNRPPLAATLAFLAMTHHQLGHADQARQFFNQAERVWQAGLRAQASANESRFGSTSGFPSSARPGPTAVDSLTEAAALLGLKTTSDLITLGNSLRDKKEYDQAIAQYDAAIALDPENPEAYLERARTWQLKSDFDKMIADASTAIHLDPKSHDAYNLRGLGWAGKREDDKAIQDYSAALKLNPRSPVLLGNRAMAYGRADSVVLAIADYTEAIKLSTGSRAAAPHYHRRGDIWYAEGELELAIGDYTNCLNLNPAPALVYNNRGLCRLRQGEHEQALEDLKQALERQPQDLPSIINTAAAKILTGRYAEALADLEQAIRIRPNLPAIRFWRGYVFEKQCQLEKATAEYDEFLKLSGKPTAGLLDRANRWGYWKEYDKAIADYTALLALEPTHHVALCSRGRAWAGKGNYDNALRDFEEAIKAAPNGADGYQALAWLRATCPDEQFRDPEAALAAATKANELSGGKYWKHLDTLAAAYAATGNFAEAIKHEQYALSLLTGLSKPDYQYRLALYREEKPYRETTEAKK